MTTSTIQTDLRHNSNREPVRADLARNAALLAVLWIAYAIVRGITAGDLAAATENARAIIDLQHTLGLPSEGALQDVLIDQRWLLKGANLYYVGVHFPITVGFLTWAWRNHRREFARVRNALIATTSAGLVIHVVYPLRPPRMMDGFVDTAALLGPDPYELGISGGAKSAGGDALASRWLGSADHNRHHLDQHLQSEVVCPGTSDSDACRRRDHRQPLLGRRHRRRRDRSHSMALHTGQPRNACAPKAPTHQLVHRKLPHISAALRIGHDHSISGTSSSP